MTSDVMVLVRKAWADWGRAQCEVAYVRVLMSAQRYADALRREDKYRPEQPRARRQSRRRAGTNSRGAQAGCWVVSRGKA